MNEGENVKWMTMLHEYEATEKDAYERFIKWRYLRPGLASQWAKVRKSTALARRQLESSLGLPVRYNFTPEVSAQTARAIRNEDALLSAANNIGDPLQDTFDAEEAMWERLDHIE